jgi:hypothetical protein
MASWVTPITDWDGVTVGREYINFGDTDRIEENTEYLYDEFVAIGYISAITTFTYPRTVISFDFYDDWNRIENNILAIKNATWEPLVWTTPQINWASVQQSFSFVDTNRIEQNLLYLYEMLNNIKEGFWYLGTFYCGYTPGDLITEEGL